MQLPEAVRSSAWSERAEIALAAVRGAGAALMTLRGTIRGREEGNGQLKTSADLAAEGWVLGFLRGHFAGELMLAEEEFEAAKVPWAGAQRYWTIDALDGTRSFVEGYPGFCVQVAFVEDGQPRVGVIDEPVAGRTYLAVQGAGAWRIEATGTTRLTGARGRALADGLRFVDSTPPREDVGAVFDRYRGEFVECGSVGLKIVRVSEDAADIYAKRFSYKLWDVAPGEVLARETGLVLASWAGDRIDYGGARSHFESILVSDAKIHSDLCEVLAG